MKTDPSIFNVWPEFVAAGDKLFYFSPRLNAQGEISREGARGLEILREGKKIVEWVAVARVPMPKTTHNFLQRCDAFTRDAAERVRYAKPT